MQYNLEQRTLQFGKTILTICKQLPKETINFKLVDQIVRSATSVGANYLEANEALSKKDFVHRLKIARKEARETSYWLELLQHHNPSVEWRMAQDEARQLRNILSSIISKFEVQAPTHKSQ